MIASAAESTQPMRSLISASVGPGQVSRSGQFSHQVMGLLGPMTGSQLPALQVFLASYVVFAAVTWLFYIRKGATFSRSKYADMSAL